MAGFRKENLPARDVTVPVSTDGETKVRKTVRTAMESEITSEAVLPAIEESVVNGVFNYTPEKNAEQIARAEEWVGERTIEDALIDRSSNVSRGKYSTDLMARGIVLYNQFSTAAGKTKDAAERVGLQRKATRVLSDLSALATVGGKCRCGTAVIIIWIGS